MESVFQQELEKLKNSIRISELKLAKIQATHKQEMTCAAKFLAIYANAYILNTNILTSCQTNQQAHLSKTVYNFFKQESINSVNLFWGTSLIYAKSVMLAVSNKVQESLSQTDKFVCFYLIEDALNKLEVYLSDNYLIEVEKFAMSYKSSQNLLKDYLELKIDISNVDFSSFRTLLEIKLKEAYYKVENSNLTTQVTDFNTIRKVSRSLEICYDNTNYHDLFAQASKCVESRGYYKQHMQIVLSILYNADLIEAQILLDRFADAKNLQTKQQKIYYTYRLLSYLDIIEQNYFQLYDSNLAFCQEFVLNKSCQLKRLIDQKPAEVRKMQ